ncbi:unnamed protein product [Cuscuta campestris]|uniref:Reverse transcriptase Ty1/copia-type domain-containing protein n=1 Tax=Cuscuta campestris TaxID=132261 RepID=A0A484LRG7_9ASTE|nr:unnamed protein product [Cuscuta campestris]
MSEKTSVTGTSSSSPTPHLAFTTISNVKLHVPILLSFSEPNYKKWSQLFLHLIRRFSLGDFLTGKSSPSSADDAEWFQLDALIQGWILSTVNDEVCDLVLSTTDSASELWKSIYNLFHDNKAARAMQLEHQFRTTTKGSLSMAAYCQTLRNLADWLNDVDASVSEHQLVLQVLCGLPDDLRAQTSFLQYQMPPPTFLQTRSALLLIEQQRADLGTGGVAGDGGTALYAGSGGPSSGGSRCYGSAGGGRADSSGGGGPDSFSTTSNAVDSSGVVVVVEAPASSTAFLTCLTQQLKGEFSMMDTGDLNFFLGINVQRTGGGLFLHQTQFAHEILERADMLHCKPISTPVDTKTKLSAMSGTPLPDPTIYRSIVGALHYLTFTRPDLTYVVQQLCLHLHAPRSSHLTALKRVLRYIHGTATHGMHICLLKYGVHTLSSNVARFSQIQLHLIANFRLVYQAMLVAA